MVQQQHELHAHISFPYPPIPMGEMLKQDQVCAHSGFVLQVRNSKLRKTSLYKADCSQTCSTSDLERVITCTYSNRKQICLCSFKTLRYPNTLEKLGQEKNLSPEMWKLHGKLSPNIHMNNSGFSHLSIITLYL